MAADNELSLESLLHRLYRQCRDANPADAYMALHDEPQFVATQVNTFRWYRRHLPSQGTLLDWGCRHAPDACMIRAAFAKSIQLHGCDFEPPAPYRAFHEYAGLTYARLDHPARLPYADAKFDAIVAAGALEHAAWDYECLKELWRCLKPDGVLVVTFLPNRWSYEEFANRVRNKPSHARRYSLRELRMLLSHTGFLPIEMGYQSRSAVLSQVGGKSVIARAAVRTLQLHRLTSCLCAIVKKAVRL